MKQTGRCKVFAIKRGGEQRIRYYLTNQLTLTIQTYLKYWKDHWNVESLHKYIKHEFALADCYSGREIPNRSYWNIVYFLNSIFHHYRMKQIKKGYSFTIYQLVEAYCLDYDISRARKHF
ncbi:MAG: hypothetical protein HeimC3_41740 [Candidatus Heimdallarchaeota archaeon LC_3]|nr:MAG: hypothetical protein HeimC3_41740 [Candidatus Heimdallarchaeota archaeon LC_3]